MPKILEENEIKLDWHDIEGRVTHPKPPASRRRSSGVHVSGIIRPLLIQSGLLKPIDQEQVEEMPLRMAVGMAWEEWAVGLWPGLIWQPGEIVVDGVAGSPDGITYGKRGKPSVLEEFKATWCSRRTYGADVTKHHSWMYQVAAYCYMLDLELARMHVLWVCGDYKLGPPAPAYVTYLIEFGEVELERHWRNVIINNKGLAVAETHD